LRPFCTAKPAAQRQSEAFAFEIIKFEEHNLEVAKSFI
jgi:hypothetical protein